MVRNFPEWATAADRELTVAEALKENNLGYLEWDLTTTNMEGSDGKKFLAPISILTVQTYGARKKVMDACSRAVVRYWHEVKDEAGHEKEDETEDTEKKTTKEERTEGEKSAGSQDPKDDDMGEGPKTATSQKVWEIKTWNWNLSVKMAPGITQFERRPNEPHPPSSCSGPHTLHQLRAQGDAEGAGTQQSPGTGRHTRRSLAMARRAQPSSSSKGPQPVRSHSHHPG